MSDTQKTKLGDAIFGSIDDNDFLNVLYDNMLYNYAILKLHLEGFQQARQVDVEAALRFADLLSKSTHPTKSDDHKMWAQAIITLLLELEPENEDVAYYAGSVLSSIGNFRGTEIAKTVYKSGYTETTLQEEARFTIEQHVVVNTGVGFDAVFQNETNRQAVTEVFRALKAEAGAGTHARFHREGIEVAVDASLVGVGITVKILQTRINDTVKLNISSESLFHFDLFL